jgi:hypothetical protein
MVTMDFAELLIGDKAYDLNNLVDWALPSKSVKMISLHRANPNRKAEPSLE